MSKVKYSQYFGGGGTFLEKLKKEAEDKMPSTFLINKFSAKKRKAFTLAEVLITLGIIGVVAAMTIPHLILNNRAHVLHKQFLKSYSTISQMVRRMEGDDIPDTEFGEKMGEYLTCANNRRNVFSSYSMSAKNLSGSTRYFEGSFFSKPAFCDLKDGTIISIGRYTLSAKKNFLIFVKFPDASSNEVDGYTRENSLLGRDVFVFEIMDGKVLPMGATGTSYSRVKYCDFASKLASNGMGCTYYAQTEGIEWFKKILKHKI